jgi:nitrite reductase (NADH) large subunit
MAPAGTRRGAKRRRRMARAWPTLRLLTVTAAVALLATLLVRPATGLFVFWDLLIPVLPLVFLLAPGLWRNICPMAAVNQLPRVLGWSRARSLPPWLGRHGYVIGLLLFFGAVSTRKLGFEDDAQAVGAVLAAALALPVAGGLAFKGKSGWCGSVCPLRAVQGLYGQAPVARVPNSHCKTCVGCTPNCPDLKPATAFRDELRDEEGRRARYRRLFAGAFPGFVLGFYTLPAGQPGVAAVYSRLGLSMLASLALFLVLERALRLRAARAGALYAASALGLFYWFNVPVLAAAIGRLAGSAPPDWAVWEARSAVLGIALAWLVRAFRREGARRPAAMALPMAGAAAAPAGPAAPADPMAASRYEVTLMPEDRRMPVSAGATLLSVLQATDLRVEAGCQMGLCGSDAVYVYSGMDELSPPGEDELATIARLGLPDYVRMACCARVLGDVVIALEPRPSDGALPEPEPHAEPVAPAPAPSPRGAASGARGARRVVILGNGIAGVTAADRIRRHDAGCEITLVSEERHHFYNRTAVSRLIWARDAMSGMYLLPEPWYDEHRICSWLNTRATTIDVRSRTVALGTGDDLPYDRLIIATGSSPLLPRIEGFGIDGSFTLRGADDAMTIRAFVQQEDCRRAAVVGGGVLGLEAAEALAKLGLEVMVVERGQRLAGAQLDEPGGRLLRQHVEGQGIEVVLGHSVGSVDGNGHLASLDLTDGTSRPVDVVVVCAGILPNAAIARDAGLQVDLGVVVDDHMRTSDRAIYAAGDVAEHAGQLYGMWPAAVEQAEIAALNAIGVARRYQGSIVTTRLRMAGVDLVSVGAPRAEPGGVELVLEDAPARSYRKLVLSDDKIVGAILLGDPSSAEAVAAAIREERDVSSHLEALEQGDWDVLNESHFEQAIAAPMTRYRGEAGGKNGRARRRSSERIRALS